MSFLKDNTTSFILDFYSMTRSSQTTAFRDKTSNDRNKQEVIFLY